MQRFMFLLLATSLLMRAALCQDEENDLAQPLQQPPPSPKVAFPFHARQPPAKTTEPYPVSLFAELCEFVRPFYLQQDAKDGSYFVGMQEIYHRILIHYALDQTFGPEQIGQIERKNALYAFLWTAPIKPKSNDSLGLTAHRTEVGGYLELGMDGSSGTKWLKQTLPSLTKLGPELGLVPQPMDEDAEDAPLETELRKWLHSHRGDWAIQKYLEPLVCSPVRSPFSPVHRKRNVREKLHTILQSYDQYNRMGRNFYFGPFFEALEIPPHLAFSFTGHQERVRKALSNLEEFNYWRSGKTLDQLKQNLAYSPPLSITLERAFPGAVVLDDARIITHDLHSFVSQPGHGRMSDALAHFLTELSDAVATKMIGRDNVLELPAEGLENLQAQYAVLTQKGPAADLPVYTLARRMGFENFSYYNLSDSTKIKNLGERLAKEGLKPKPSIPAEDKRLVAATIDIFRELDPDRSTYLTETLRSEAPLRTRQMSQHMTKAFYDLLVLVDENNFNEKVLHQNYFQLNASQLEEVRKMQEMQKRGLHGIDWINRLRFAIKDDPAKLPEIPIPPEMKWDLERVLGPSWVEDLKVAIKPGTKIQLGDRLLSGPGTWVSGPALLKLLRDPRIASQLSRRMMIEAPHVTTVEKEVPKQGAP